MEKVCECCKKSKSILDFFASPFEARASKYGTSKFCKQCHAEGKIKNGYGWWPDKWKTPADI